MLELLIKFPIESSATIITALPIASFLYRLTFKNHVLRYFFVYLIAKLSIELIMFYMASEGIENLFLSNALTIIGFFLFARMFHDVFESQVRRIVVQISEFLFICVVSFDLVRDGMYYSFRYAGMAECIFILLFCLMYFHELIRHPTIPNLLTYAFFWVCAGMLIYFACCTVISPMAFYLDRWPKNEEMHIFVLIPYILETFYLTIISVGIFVSKS